MSHRVNLGRDSVILQSPEERRRRTRRRDQLIPGRSRCLIKSRRAAYQASRFRTNRTAVGAISRYALAWRLSHFIGYLRHAPAACSVHRGRRAPPSPAMSSRASLLPSIARTKVNAGLHDRRGAGRVVPFTNRFQSSAKSYNFLPP